MQININLVTIIFFTQIAMYSLTNHNPVFEFPLLIESFDK